MTQDNFIFLNNSSIDSNKVMLHINGIKKTFPSSSSNAFILHPFSVTLFQGEILSLVGESGSGKTSLLRIIAGFDWADAGYIKLNNEILFDNSYFLSPEKRKIGFIFQDNSLFPHLDIKDNICYGIASESKAEKNRRLNWILNLMELSDYKNNYPYELSGGEQQRVAIARSLITYPDLLLLDEPFNNLDPIIQNKIRLELCHLFKKIKTTVIFVSHNTKDALPISDRIAIIRKGALQQIDTPQRIYHNPNNGYVASFFGMCNFFCIDALFNINPENIANNLMSHICEQEEASHFIRVENFYVSPVPKKNYIKGIVLSTFFYGAYVQTIISVKSSSIPLIIHSNTHCKIDAGHEIYFYPKEGSICPMSCNKSIVSNG